MWIEENCRLLPGRARVEILQAGDGQNSLNTAWPAPGMSYRAAWKRIPASEERLGIRFVENEKTRA
jgi:molybdate transport system regulatory protein